MRDGRRLPMLRYGGSDVLVYNIIYYDEREVQRVIAGRSVEGDERGPSIRRP